MENPYVYSNESIIFSSDKDFLIKFLTKVPQLEKDNKVSVSLLQEVNILQGPIQFKKLYSAMKAQMDIFEKKYGEIIINTKSEPPQVEKNGKK